MANAGCYISSYRCKTLQVLLAAFVVVSIILVILIHQQSVDNIYRELKGPLGLLQQQQELAEPSNSNRKRFFNSQKRQYNLMEEITNADEVSSNNNFGSKECTLGDSLSITSPFFII